ncbi:MULTISPECIES: hypothetical protein [unclassified Exiguobacterium]|uniref:hypothetical protein n=1 Tax=unclassified Exiguobacterium TaxID=2644629 RepID=UPI0025BE7DDE|nr:MULTISPECIES: hypothetical protein [unclassified Exiguobacterium]
MEDLQSLLAIERFAEDAFRVKKTYVDMTGDLLSGILLGQIVYWHLPSKDGRSKLRVQKEGKLWLAKGRADWYDEIRITPKQFDRAIKILVEKGFIETRLFKFDGSPMVHIHLHPEHVIDSVFPQRSKSILPKGENPISPKVEIHFDERLKTLTETTTDTTSETTSVKNKPVGQQVDLSLFESIWKLYPKKVDKKKAIAAYTRAIKKGTSHDTIATGLQHYLRYLEHNKHWLKPQDGGRWFEKERWTDEHDLSQPERTSSTPDHSHYDPTFGKELPF